MTLAAALLLGACGSPPHGAPTSPDAAPTPQVAAPDAINEALALATFDAAWNEVEVTDFDPSHAGVDWAQVRDELRPKAANCTSRGQLRTVLNEMVGRLGRSHFGIIPASVADRMGNSGGESAASASSSTTPAPAPAASATAAPSTTAAATNPTAALPPPSASSREWALPGSYGMTLRLVEGSIVVLTVAPDSPAARAGVQAGWRVLRKGGVDPLEGLDALPGPEESMGRYAREHLVHEVDHDRSARECDFLFVDGADQEVTRTMSPAPYQGKTVKFATLPLLPMIFESREASDDEWRRALRAGGDTGIGPGADARPGTHEGGAAPPRIGIVSFSVWMMPMSEPFDQAIDRFRAADGLIIDLRGNPGGIGVLVTGTGGHLLDEPRSLGSMHLRDATLEFKVNPRVVTPDGRIVKPFAGPVAILTDPLTASTSEVFAGGLQDVGRARIFGETSAGAVLPATMYRLPDGDVLLHAIADFRVPSGTLLEGRGVIPDEPRTLRRADILRDGDPVLLDAIRWIDAERLRRSAEPKGGS